MSINDIQAWCGRRVGRVYDDEEFKTQKYNHLFLNDSPDKLAFVWWSNSNHNEKIYIGS